MADKKTGGVLAGVSIPKDKAEEVEEVAAVKEAITEGMGGFVGAAISTLAGNDSKPIDKAAVSAAYEKAKEIPAAVGHVLSGVKVDEKKADEVEAVAGAEEKMAAGSAGSLKTLLGNAMGVD